MPKKAKIETGDSAGVPFWFYAAVLAWAPLPFGSNTAWSSNLLVALVALAGALWAVFAIVRPTVIRIPLRRFAPYALAAAALLVWFVVQNASWTPASWHHPMWASAASTLATPIAGAIGLDPAAATETLGRLGAYALAFLLAAQMGRRTETAVRLAYVLAAIAVAYALYGLVVQLGDLQMVAWEPKRYYQDSLTSTFVNRNSYGTFAGLGLLVLCGLLVRAMRRSAAEGIAGGGLSQMLDNMKFREFFLIGGFVVVAAALILTNSRGATLSTLVALILFIVLTASNQRSWRVGTIVAAAIIVVGGWMVFSVSSAGLVTRLLDFEQDLIGRREVAEITLRAIGDRPLVGYGLGSFEGAFHLFRDGSLDPAIPAFDKAHNTYLELALEAGLPAAILMVAMVGALALACTRGALIRRRNSAYPAMAAAATTLVGIHALVDFSLQIPAVTVYFAAILGLGYAQARSSQGEAERPSAEPARGLDAWRSAAEM
ncbi:MAG: O-antigen ligase family protein [Alphaproteobacteria bacterium]